MPIQAVEPRRLYRQIADQIGGLIERGEFAPGTRLPPERVLAQQLGVSRPSLREALIALEIAGLIDVRIGSGIYVRDNAQPGVVAAADGEPGPFELIRARWLVEGEIAALAAKSLKKSDLAGMHEALEMMVEENSRNAPTQDGDRLFHLRIAEACGNSALALVVRNLWDQRYGPMYSKMEEHFNTPRLRTQALKDHRAILAALASRSAGRARSAMRSHLERVEREFAKGWDAVKRSDKPAGARRARSRSAGPGLII